MQIMIKTSYCLILFKDARTVLLRFQLNMTYLDRLGLKTIDTYYAILNIDITKLQKEMTFNQ